MQIGMYRVDSVQEGRHAKAVRKFASLAYVGAVDSGFSTATAEQRATELRAILKRLVKHDFEIVLDLEIGANRLGFGQALKAAKKVWNSVRYIILADEDPSLDYDAMVRKVRAKMLILGLSNRPIGATFTPDQCLNLPIDTVQAIDFVSVEAYHDLGNPDPRKQILKRTKAIKKRLGSKPLIIVAQAYDRNGAFRDINAICRINSDTYSILCKDDSRILAMVGFAYGRQGGVRDLPELQAVYRGIWSDLNAATV